MHEIRLWSVIQPNELVWPDNRLAGEREIRTVMDGNRSKWALPMPMEAGRSAGHVSAIQSSAPGPQADCAARSRVCPLNFCFRKNEHEDP